MKFGFLNFTLYLYCFLTNGQQDDWWRNVYVNRSSSIMVSSIFCGHNKQTAVQEDVPLPPSCAWGEERMLPWTSGGSRHSPADCRKSARRLVLPLPDTGTRTHLPALTQFGSNARPRQSLSQLRLSAHLAWHASVGCYLQRLPYRMKLVWNREKGLGQEDQSPAHPTATLSKCSPSFLSQKLFASVLLDSRYPIKSINSCTCLLHVPFAFQPGLPLKLASLLWIWLDLTQGYNKVY